MKELKFLVIPGFSDEGISMDEITQVDIKENYIFIRWENRTYGIVQTQCLLKGDYIPDFISENKDTHGDSYQLSHALTESDFEKYKAVLKEAYSHRSD